MFSYTPALSLVYPVRINLSCSSCSGLKPWNSVWDLNPLLFWPMATPHGSYPKSRLTSALSLLVSLLLSRFGPSLPVTYCEDFVTHVSSGWEESSQGLSALPLHSGSTALGPTSGLTHAQWTNSSEAPHSLCLNSLQDTSGPTWLRPNLFSATCSGVSQFSSLSDVISHPRGALVQLSLLVEVTSALQGSTWLVSSIIPLGWIYLPSPWYSGGIYFSLRTYYIVFLTFFFFFFIWKHLWISLSRLEGFSLIAGKTILQ